MWGQGAGRSVPGRSAGRGPCGTAASWDGSARRWRQGAAVPMRVDEPDENALVFLWRRLGMSVLYRGTLGRKGRAKLCPGLRIRWLPVFGMNI